MRIPDGPNGMPTLSASQFRVYGAGGFLLDEQEEEQGCPRRYEAKYVSKTISEEYERPYPLAYGSLFHDVLFRMEEHGETPDEAMANAFDPSLPQEAWTELRADVERYLERGASPSDRFGVVAVENDLWALLYVDEEYGPIYYRGKIDWIGIDLQVEDIAHVVDYKTNRQPPKVEHLWGDVQMRGYHWLVEQNASTWFARTPRIITHLDVVKFRDIEVAYTRQMIEDWHSWAVAVARAILRDEEAKPRINPGCGHCPIQLTCPAFERLPSTAKGMVTRLAHQGDEMTPEQRLAWRDKANQTRLLLEKAVKGIDEAFKDAAAVEGGLVVGDEEFVRETAYVTEIDTRALHRAMGDPFYDVVRTSKAAIERATSGWDSGAVAPVRRAIETVPSGTKITRRQRAKEER